MTNIASRPRAMLLALHILAMGALAAPAPAQAMQILDAADHAELAAEISATNVNRIALSGRPDREGGALAGRVRGRARCRVGRPLSQAADGRGGPGAGGVCPAAGAAGGARSVTLFIGTEKGFTYRLTLLPAARDSAQILIRNADAVPSSVAFAASPPAGEPHVAALVRLVRAVAAREPLPGTAIHAGGGALGDGIRLIETWRGTGAFPRPRFAALVFEAARPASQDADDSAGLAGTIGSLPGIGSVAALWLAPPATGPSGGRLGVAVVEAAGAGDPR